MLEELLKVVLTGKVSLKVTPLAGMVPIFENWRVYEMVSPGITGDPPSDKVTFKSGRFVGGLMGVISPAELFPGTGSTPCVPSSRMDAVF